jgi:hypothetical protein
MNLDSNHGYFYKHKNEPKNIIDIFDKMDEYISEMRDKQDLETIPKYLKQYAWEYFREMQLDKQKIKSLAIFSIDKIYRNIAELRISDIYNKSFFVNVIPFFWDTFQNRGVDLFYIVDNSFHDDGKFELIVDLFSVSGVAVVHPYGDTILKYNEIEKEIKDYMKSVRMIMYIEKNDKVNYLKKIINIARESRYLTIFRNKDSKDPHIEVF